MSSRTKVALCRIEHGDEVYNFGDEVPDAVAEEYASAVGDKPLTSTEVEGLSKKELVALIKRQNGMEDTTNA